MTVSLAVKACAIVVRGSAELLVFRHPRGGVQFVKGTIEAGEAPPQAALRELQEESGISGARIERDLGVWQSGLKSQLWSFHLCAVEAPLPDKWVHRTKDGGGLDFPFHWHPLDQEPNDEWRPVFQRALEFVRRRMQGDA